MSSHAADVRAARIQSAYRGHRLRKRLATVLDEYRLLVAELESGTGGRVPQVSMSSVGAAATKTRTLLKAPVVVNSVVDRYVLKHCRWAYEVKREMKAVVVVDVIEAARGVQPEGNHGDDEEAIVQPGDHNVDDGEVAIQPEGHNVDDGEVIVLPGDEDIAIHSEDEDIAIHSEDEDIAIQSDDKGSAIQSEDEDIAVEDDDDRFCLLDAAPTPPEPITAMSAWSECECDAVVVTDKDTIDTAVACEKETTRADVDTDDSESDTIERVYPPFVNHDELPPVVSIGLDVDSANATAAVVDNIQDIPDDDELAVVVERELVKLIDTAVESVNAGADETVHDYADDSVCEDTLDDATVVKVHDDVTVAMLSDSSEPACESRTSTSSPEVKDNAVAHRDSAISIATQDGANANDSSAMEEEIEVDKKEGTTGLEEVSSNSHSAVDLEVENVIMPDMVQDVNGCAEITVEDSSPSLEPTVDECLANVAAVPKQEGRDSIADSTDANSTSIKCNVEDDCVEEISVIDDDKHVPLIGKSLTESVEDVDVAMPECTATIVDNVQTNKSTSLSLETDATTAIDVAAPNAATNAVEKHETTPLKLENAVSTAANKVIEAAVVNSTAWTLPSQQRNLTNVTLVSKSLRNSASMESLGTMSDDSLDRIEGRWEANVTDVALSQPLIEEIRRIEESIRNRVELLRAEHAARVRTERS